MADGTKALLLKKIFSEAEKVMKCSMDRMMTMLDRKDDDDAGCIR